MLESVASDQKSQPQKPETAFSHIVIQDITPSVDNGRYPVKRIVGEPCIVEADAFRDGPDVIRVTLKYRPDTDQSYRDVPMTSLGNDRWQGVFIPDRPGRYFYTVEAWTDRLATWLWSFEKKAAAGRDLRSHLLDGLSLVERMIRRAGPADSSLLRQFASLLRNYAGDYASVLAFAVRPDIAEALLRASEHYDATTYNPPLELIVDREKARFSAWYELFVRSQTDDPARYGSFREAEKILPEIADMGFDVLYLTPIHPIGKTNRKGKNNSLIAEPDAVGSPWAIGNALGGHDALDPALGDFADFARFIAAANELGLEPAMDFALQCSPDHPWVRDHPEWFKHRPDGTIMYAENPPKEYQDIYPLDFDGPHRAALMNEILRVLLFWIEHGIRIFRVDNPHTKPVFFWKWLIESVRRRYPDVIFLAEAFTRPKMMKLLAAVGFNQSYTYFTWRNSRAELTEYLTELTQAPTKDYFRPNFFTNTPDILPPFLQTGGMPAFKIRLVLAATLSSAYGIYSGFEFCEADALPNSEEYLNAEKYEIKVRDRTRPGIREFIAQVNRIRRQNPALQQFLNLRFLNTDNDNILLYLKTDDAGQNRIIVAVNLDPFHPHHTTGFVPLEALGVRDGLTYNVTDLLTGASYRWSAQNYIRLDPFIQPAHIFRVEPADEV